MIELTKEDRIELVAIHRQLKNKKECDMIKAILALADGYTAYNVSRLMLIDEDTVRNWKRKFENRKSLSEWLSNECKGYSGKLTIAQEQEVSAYVEANTIADSKQVIEFIRDNFGKEYSLSGVINLLHRLNFTYKKTTLIPSKYDEEKQAVFKKTYEELEKELPQDEALVFMDGVHPQHNTTCTNAWIKVGQTKEIKSNTGRNRINLNGIYNPANQDILIHESDTINAETTIDFLKEIEDFYKDKTKISIIVDNAKYYRNKDVTAFLATSRIHLIFLPPYSPNLNLIERLWKYVRKKIINNGYYEKFKEFRAAVLAFFEECKNQDQRESLKQFIGTKLHLLAPVKIPNSILV